MNTDHALLLRLIAFVDTEHDFAGSLCHPEPGTDCEIWCRSCMLLRSVRDDVLAEARSLWKTDCDGRWIDTGEVT